MEKGLRRRFPQLPERNIVQAIGEGSCSEGCNLLNDQSFRRLQKSAYSEDFEKSLNGKSFR